jgi:hypothetical protein
MGDAPLVGFEVGGFAGLGDVESDAAAARDLAALDLGEPLEPVDDLADRLRGDGQAARDLGDREPGSAPIASSIPAAARHESQPAAA